MSHCEECHHVIGEKGRSHTHCRSHAACSDRALYSSYDCPVCTDLWQVASTFEDPGAAVDSYNTLLVWVRSFRKNTRTLERPSGIWQVEDEQQEFDQLREDLQQAAGVSLSAFP